MRAPHEIRAPARYAFVVVLRERSGLSSGASPDQDAVRYIENSFRNAFGFEIESITRPGEVPLASAAPTNDSVSLHDRLAAIEGLIETPDTAAHERVRIHDAAWRSLNQRVLALETDIKSRFVSIEARFASVHTRLNFIPTFSTPPPPEALQK